MAMVPIPGSTRRPHPRRMLLSSLLCVLSLSGCSGRLELPQVVYLAIGVNADQSIDADLLGDFQERLNGLESGYRQIHPNTRFQFSVYPDERIDDAVRRRTNAGLGPDLLFINGDTARYLLEQGLIDPFPANRALENLFSAYDLNRMRTASGQLAGLPIVVQPQVACFNRQRLSTPPSTLSELLKTSAKGHSIGLSVELNTLLWTAGSMGTIEALNRAAAGTPPSAEERQQISKWLRWLQNASDQQRVSFFGGQLALQNEFGAGRLDWITCSSMSLPKLRKSLGQALGVASLPSGPGGLASPINRLRVMALGRSSSREGRQRALSFSRFSVNPLVQRSLTLGSQTLLPANRFVKVPIRSSRALQAMADSQEGGQQVAPLIGLIPDDDPRLAAAQGLITQLVFGEISPESAADAFIALFQRRQR
jgi:arabinogalactan oligomer/maltooligosaccharide transport system substrate-binding protein